MRRSSVAALLAGLLAGLAAACHPTSAAAGAPEDPAGSAPTVRGPLGCPDADTPEGSRCIEWELLEVLAASGPAAAIAELERRAELSDAVRRDGHAYAHAIGIAAYDGTRDVSLVFSECTPAFQSGCYHGVVESYFGILIGNHGGHLDSVMVNALCRRQREDPDQRWLHFQCAHGMGHGLSMVAGYHLPTSLAGCDLVSDPWERESCYGGVFMENIVHATRPHHEVGRPEGALAGGGDAHAADPGDHAHGHAHGHTHGAAADDFPPLRPEEPLYPCSVLDARYLESCYQMQTSAVLFFNDYDFARTAAVCAEAPEAFRPTCFRSLGRDVSSYTGQDDGRAVSLCAAAPAAYEPWCHTGYAKNLIDLTANPGEGIRYCRGLPPGESRRVCYVAVGEQVWVLADDVATRESMCAAVDPQHREDCRHGADLPAAGTAVGGTEPARVQ